jgi:hypothetical protein
MENSEWKARAEKAEQERDEARSAMASGAPSNMRRVWESMGKIALKDAWDYKTRAEKAEAALAAAIARAEYLDSELAKADEWKAHNTALKQRVGELEAALAAVMKDSALEAKP